MSDNLDGLEKDLKNKPFTAAKMFLYSGTFRDEKIFTFELDKGNAPMFSDNGKLFVFRSSLRRRRNPKTHQNTCIISSETGHP